MVIVYNAPIATAATDNEPVYLSDINDIIIHVVINI